MTIARLKAVEELGPGVTYLQSLPSLFAAGRLETAARGHNKRDNQSW